MKCPECGACHSFVGFVDWPDACRLAFREELGSHGGDVQGYGDVGLVVYLPFGALDLRRAYAAVERWGLAVGREWWFPWTGSCRYASPLRWTRPNAYCGTPGAWSFSSALAPLGLV
jgi:hypothetical protein